jgi:hypothetical protein
MSCTCAMPLPSIEHFGRCADCGQVLPAGVAHQLGERAAIIEFDAHQDRDAAEHQAVLDLRAAMFREGQGQD